MVTRIKDAGARFVDFDVEFNRNAVAGSTGDGPPVTTPDAAAMESPSHDVLLRDHLAIMQRLREQRAAQEQRIANAVLDAAIAMRSGQA